MSPIEFIFSNIIFGVIVILFKFTLSNFKSFVFNRLILLFMPFLSTLWLIPIEWSTITGSFPIIQLPVIELTTDLKSSNSFSYLFYAYFLISLGLLIYSGFSLYHKLKAGIHQYKKEGISIRLIQGIDSYSFGKTMYLNKTDIEDSLIQEHEKIHIEQFHWLDMILVQLIFCLLWFNPFVWIWKQMIQQNHEYLADSKVMRRSNEAQKDYIHLLLDRAMNTKHFTIENYFSIHSLISKRITMLNKTKKKQPTRIVIGASAILLASLVLGACAKNLDESPQNYGDLKSVEIFTEVENMPEFNGGFEKLVEYLGSEIKYPESIKLSGDEGKVLVSFVVNEDGTISNAEMIQGFQQDADAEAMRVIKSMPNWKPGETKGKKVKVKMVLPIQFKMG